MWFAVEDVRVKVRLFNPVWCKAKRTRHQGNDVHPIDSNHRSRSARRYDDDVHHDHWIFHTKDIHPAPIADLQDTLEGMGASLDAESKANKDSRGDNLHKRTRSLPTHTPYPMSLRVQPRCKLTVLNPRSSCDSDHSSLVSSHYSLIHSLPHHTDFAGRASTWRDDKASSSVVRTSNMILLDEPNVKERFYIEQADVKSPLQQADVFVCQYLTSLCEVYMGFNRSILIIAPVRYELGRHDDADKWEQLNVNLRRIASSPRNVVAANNRYDAEYIAHFTGIRNVPILRARAQYVDDAVTYAPTRHEILIGPHRAIHPFLKSELVRASLTYDVGDMQPRPHRLVLRTIRELYPRYTFKDLASHPAIVVLPYAVSTM